MGSGPIYTHFTDLQGLQGITGLDGLAAGESTTVNQLTFGNGSNGFLAGNPGDVFITDLGPNASNGALNQIGVFGDQQQFAIQMSNETLFDNEIRPIMTGSSIWTIPGGTTLTRVFEITARF
jgi:hypothetical protein